MFGMNRWYFVLVLMAVVSPAGLYAQFQPPTQEELTMTSELKAPGAAAVYLYREEVWNDELHSETVYERIKVLGEKGKELATVSVPYPKDFYEVTDIKARTIHADGTIVPLEVKPADLMALRVKNFQENKMVFTLPDVQIGSILEYRFILRYGDHTISAPTWLVQTPYYVRREHFGFVPWALIDRMLMTTILPQRAKVEQDSAGRYSLDISDVPALPDEEFMPPVKTIGEQVKFYLTHIVSKDEYWKDAGNTWSKGVNHFAEGTKLLREAVDGLVAPGDTEEARANKLYDAVMALENTDFTRKKTKAELKQLKQKDAKTAEDVWRAKSGSRDDLAELLVALLRIAKLDATAAYVSNRDQQIFNPDFMSMSQLNDEIVRVVINGKEVYLDPGEKGATFGQLHWKHTLAGGIRQAATGAVIDYTPAGSYKDATTARVADVNLAADGEIKGSARITMSGPEALRWRQLAITSDEDELKKQFEADLQEKVPDGVKVELQHFLGLEDGNSLLMAAVNLTGNLASATGKRLFVPSELFASHATHPFVATAARQTLVDMHYAFTVTDDVTLHVPDGYALESAPGDETQSWAGHGLFRTKAVTTPQTVRLVRSMALATAMFQAKEYADLRDFYQKAAGADSQQIVLVRSAGQ